MNNLLAALLAFSAPPAGATPWHAMGPRAMGMGGAQTAGVEGPLASYWNPAAYALEGGVSGFAVSFGARGEFTGTVLQGANDVNQIASDCNSNPAGAACLGADIPTALARLGQPGNGALLDAGGGLSIKIGRVDVFVNNLTYVGASPSVDLVNTAAGVGAGSVAQNQSKLLMRGGNFTELGFGYAREIKDSGLILGGNLKGIIGKVGYYAFPIATSDPGGGSFGDFTKSAKTSFQPGVDLGLLWDARKAFEDAFWRPRLALVGRNLNNPTFSQPDGAKTAGERSKFSVHGQARAGAALSPLRFWHLACDLDLTDNVTNVDGYKSRYFSAGTEVNVFNRPWINIPLRAGLQKNVSAGASGFSYTAGFGLNFLHVVLDMGVMVSSRRTDIQSQGKSERVPNNVAASAQLAMFFGGGPE